MQGCHCALIGFISETGTEKIQKKMKRIERKGLYLATARDPVSRDKAIAPESAELSVNVI